MNTTHWGRVPLASACCAALTALTLPTAATAGAATTAHAGSGGAPIVRTGDGASDRRQVPGQHRRGAGRARRASRGDRGRIPTRSVAGRGPQHPGLGHQLFDLPNAPFHPAPSPDQQTLAARMRAAWVNFAATGNPATAALPWPAFGHSQHMVSLVPSQPQAETDFATRHHCAFWAAG